MALVKWILLLVVVIGLSVLFAENSHETLTLKFFGRVFLNIPFYYVVGAALLVGALLTMLLNLVREVQLRGGSAASTGISGIATARSRNCALCP